MSIQFIQQNFYLIQVAAGIAFFIVAWIFFRPKPPESNFRVREADRNIQFGKPTSPEADLANAKLRADPLQLTGIRLDGKPHEILGVRAQASPDEIQKAYRELMKRYHPDKIGRPGTREWNDAQKIAETINRARNDLLKSRSTQKS